MANYATLKAAINAVIKANGNKEITGTVLNETLTAMVNSLGADYQFAGVATPSTNPGTPDQNVAYLASQAGTYTNFNAVVLPAGIHLLLWNGAWSTQTFFTIDEVPTAGSNNLVSSGGLDGTTIKEPNFISGYLQSNGTYIEDSDYLLSDYLPCELYHSIVSSSNIYLTIHYYDKDKNQQSVESLLYNEVYKEIKQSYKYFRFWGAIANVNTAVLVRISSKIIGNGNDLMKIKTCLQNTETDENSFLKNVAWEHAFINSSNGISYNKSYCCSPFIKIDDVFSILTDGTSFNGNLVFYDEDYNFLSGTVTSTSFNSDIRTYKPVCNGAKYFRIWFACDNVETAATKLRFIIETASIYKNNQSTLISENIFGDSYIKPTFKFGFVGSQGVYVNNYNYCISEFIPIDRFEKVQAKNLSRSISYNLYTSEDYSTILYYSASTGTLDIASLKKAYPTAQYITIWMSGVNPVNVQNELIFTPSYRTGFLNDIKVKVLETQRKQKNLIYLNNCKELDDFNSCVVSNGVYTDNTSNLSVGDNGVILPYGAGVYSWIRKHIRLAKKTMIYEFFANSGCESINIYGFGFSGGANGVSTFPGFTIDIQNGLLKCTSGASVQYAVSTGKRYRLKLKQEDKHTELTIIDVATGTSSSVLQYNGFTTGNNGLWYDTWCFNPIGAAMEICNISVSSPAKTPFLGIMGDSITVGFYSTVTDGIDHTKYAYLVGVGTGKDFFSSGRGGGAFQNLLGGNIEVDGLRSLTFDGSLECEVAELKPNYVMVTIGTNGGGSYAQYKSVVEYIIALGLTPILNTLPIRADGGTDENVSYVASANENIMQIWKDYNIHGARFDLATSLNNNGHTINADMFANDRIHPNDEGHAAMAARAMLDCPELFE